MKLLKTKTVKEVNPLPYGITEVEYLENIGSSFINTGIPASSNLKVEMRFKITETPNNFAWMIGGRDETAVGAGYTFGSNGSAFASDFQGTRVTGSFNLTANNVYTVIKDGNVCTCNNETITNADVDFQCVTSLYLWTLCDNGNITNAFIKSQLYYCKIWDDGVLVRDFIPALVGDKPCLYDLVSKKPFYNAGTDEFSYGREIHRVEYLETTGTQYIDCGLTGNLNTSYSITFQNNQLEQQGIVFGSRSSATSNNISTISPAAIGGSNVNVVNDFGNYNNTRQPTALQSFTDKVTAYNSKTLRTVYNHVTGITDEATTSYSTSFTTPITTRHSS